MMPMWRRAGGGCRRGAWTRKRHLKSPVSKHKWRRRGKRSRRRAALAQPVPPSSRPSEEGKSQVSSLENQMEGRGQGEQVATALAAASATQFASTCPTRDEENHQNEAKLDEHVHITQNQENEHVVAEFGVYVGLDNGVTKRNLEEDRGGVEGTTEAGNGPCIPRGEECAEQAETALAAASANQYDCTCPTGRRKTLKTKPNLMSMCRLRKSKRISMLWPNWR